MSHKTELVNGGRLAPMPSTHSDVHNAHTDIETHAGEGSLALPRHVVFALAVGLIAVLGGAVYLAITRAPALLLDLANLAGCL